jgi:hypothetical protein
MYRLNIKKFIDVWTTQVILTAKPSQYQKCGCLANQNGVGEVEVVKCPLKVRCELNIVNYAPCER